MTFRLIVSALLLLLAADTLHAQLISWRDLIEGDLPQPDERIWYGTGELAFGDLWLPDDDAHTTVILIHGGCWLDVYPGVEIMNHMADALRNEGFAVWNIEYRRLGHKGGGYPGTFLDVAFGADILHSIARNHNLNLDRVIASGHSAGGHLATWLAARKNISKESPLYIDDSIEIHSSTDIHGVISLAGINDLERYARYGSSSCGSGTVERLVDYEKRGDDAYLDTSPVNMLPLGIPIIEVTAAFDAPVPPFFGFHFVQAAREADDRAELILQPEAGHFEMIAPWSSEWEEVLKLFRTILD
jgi:acetyl esterase/lipase